MSADFLSSRDWRQDRKLEELGSTLARVRGELSTANTTLKAQLASVTGSLEERITRLSRAFDAFVELSDVRAVLAMFTDTALVRYHARALVTSLVESTDAPGASPPDVPGYWLSAAVRVARARYAGDEPVAADLTEALRLDDVRTGTFLALLAALAPGAGSTPGADEETLAEALGRFSADGPITGAQRLLWRL
jgi:hypothetical protein